MSEIKYLSRQIDFDNLTYYLKSKNISPINFIGFKATLHLYRDIFDGNIKLAKAEEDQKKFKSDLNAITWENTKKKSADQIKTIENIKNLSKSRQKVVDLFNNFARNRYESIYETKHGKGLKILTPKQMLQRLPIALAQVKADNNSESLLNEIRQIVYYCINQKKSLKKYTIT